MKARKGLVYGSAMVLAAIGILVSISSMGASATVSDEVRPDAGDLKAMFSIEGNGISAPNELVVRSGDNFAILTWKAPKETNGIALEGYIVQRSIDGGQWGNVTMVDAKTLKFTDAWISNGMAVVYRIVAVGGGGWSPPSNEATANPMGAPWPPVNVRTSIEGPSVLVGWSSPRYDGGSAITSYAIFRKADADREFEQVAEVPSGERTWFDRAVSGNATVKYYVVARNAAGSSAPSEAALAEDVPGIDGASVGSGGPSMMMFISGSIALVAIAGISAAIWTVRSRRRAEIERRMRFCQSVQYVDPKCQGAAFFTPTARHL